MQTIGIARTLCSTSLQSLRESRRPPHDSPPRPPHPNRSSPPSRTSTPDQPIPRISRTLIPRSQRLNLSLSIPTRSDRGLISTTDVDQFVADAVRDDVGVKRFLLVCGDGGVVGLEGEFIGWDGC